jgi:putative ABC transport system permease protein
MIRQVLSVVEINMRGLSQRLGRAAVIAIGIASAVAIMVSVLAMSEGFSKVLSGTARADRAIVVRVGSQQELTSVLSRDNVQTILSGPGIRFDADAKPIGTADVVLTTRLSGKGSKAVENVTVRGIGQNVMKVRPETRIVAGRMFRPAVHELIAGRAAVSQFGEVQVGRQVSIRSSEWTIVGEFESNGDSHDSELQGDNEALLSALQRNYFQSVTVELVSAAAFDQLKASLTSNPTLNVDVQRETDFYSKQSAQVSKLLDSLAYFVGGIMALGAIFGSVNTMYSAVESRIAEIGTLRAIGFGGVAIIVALLFESVVLALVGGALGGLAAWFVFDGHTASTIAASSTQLIFHLTVTLRIVVAALVGAIGVGFVAGVFPAVAAARVPVAVALRAR